MAIRISTWPIWRGSRVNSGSSTNGRELTTTRSTQSPGMSTRGTLSTSSLTWTSTTPSRNAAASAMVGVSSVLGAGVQVALAVGLLGAQQRHVRGEVDEHPRVQLDVGVDRPDLDLAVCEQLRHAHALRAGVGEIETAGHAALEDVQVLAQD